MQSVTRGPVDQTRTEIAFLLLGTKRNLAKVGDALPTTSDKLSRKDADHARKYYQKS